MKLIGLQIFEYLDFPYSFYITKIRYDRIVLRINCIYFFNFKSELINEVSIRKLTKIDPELLSKMKNMIFPSMMQL